jgi:hypothetical protein
MDIGTQILKAADYVQPTRNFSLAYVITDSLLLILFVVLLFVKKKRVMACWSLAGGILYFLVDFGYFYLLSHSREVYYAWGSQSLTLSNAGETASILLWMSLSYGIYDFAFIWMWLSNDDQRKELTAYILTVWIAVPLIASFFNALLGDNTLWIETTRSTGKYHGIMALILLVGYLFVIIYNLFTKGEKVPILKLFVIGFLAQFFWEFLLLVFGIRSQNYNVDITRQIMTLLQDSLIETNLGMPYIYFIHKDVMDSYNEDGSRKQLPKA